MPTFSYRVRDRKGKAVTGVTQGASEEAVAESLAKQGYFPMSILETKPAKFSAKDMFKPRVKKEELIVFTRQLWTLQKAGLPLLAGLGSLREQAVNPVFKKVIVKIIKDLEEGSSLSAALATQPQIFNLVYVHMVKAGEASGKLDEIFLELSEMGKFESDTRDKIRSATLYPILTLISLFIAFIVVTTFVVPKFSSIFEGRGQELPLPTKILLTINNIVRHHWMECLAVIGAVIFGVRSYIATKPGRYVYDMLKLKIPVIGKLVFFLQLSRFSRILSELLKTGVPILQALQLVSDTINNKVIENALTSVQHSVNEGKGMSAAMKKTAVFTPMVVQMVEVGEQSGRTDELLAYVAEYYEDQSNHLIKNFSMLIEPILLCVLGGIVTLLALGVFMPVWQLSTVVQAQ